VNDGSSQDQNARGNASPWDSFRGPLPVSGSRSFLRTAVGILILVVLVGLAVTLLFWGLIVGAIVVALAAAALGVRTLIRRLRGDPTAPSDTLRRNVRVIRRESV
jgi:fatty acid desaturase